MAEPSKKKAKKKKATRQRKERRFVPEATQGGKLVAIVGMVGAAIGGAGVYGQWIRDEPLTYAPYLVAVGFVLLGVALWFADAGLVPVRVGDAGVAIEKGDDLVRLAWCDMSRIHAEGDKLVLGGEELTLEVPIKSHPKAASWILSEAAHRVPDAMDVKRSVVDGLPEPKDSDGELLTIESVQVTGRHCKECGKVVSFEREARLCPVCAEVYHDSHVPKKCATCESDIAGRAFKA
jgi:hypothetical protein